MKKTLLIILIVANVAFAAEGTLTLKGIGKSTPIRKAVFEQVDFMSASDLFSALQARGKWN